MASLLIAALLLGQPVPPPTEPKAPPATPRAATKPPPAPQVPSSKAAPAPAAKRPALAPEACRTLVETTATLFETVTAPLLAEAQKREEGNAEAGQRLFETALTDNAAALAAARAAARTLEATLDADGRKACEDYSATRFDKAVTRFSTVAGFYAGRVAVFRALGVAFAR